MKHSFMAMLVILLTAFSVAACGVKSPPKYSPDAPKSELKKS
ncbi:lipoprotein [Sneathiella sp.]|nr:lipoprotein [Sneathiella sp.]